MAKLLQIKSLFSTFVPLNKQPPSKGLITEFQHNKSLFFILIFVT